MPLTKVQTLQSGTGALPRNLDDTLSEIYSVKDFGATGDGVTDDTTSCQNAVNAALAAKNGTVVFPPGTYKLTSYLGSISTPASTTSIALIGDERAKLDFQPSVYLNYGIAFKSGASDTVGYKVVHIEGLTIDCNHKVATAISIRFQNTGSSGATLTKYAGVKNCKIEDVKGVNNAGVTQDAIGIQIQGYENAEVTNNFIKDVIRVKNADGCDACRGITIQDCHITNITNNYIEDVSHGNQDGTDSVTIGTDSDAIVVFSNTQSSKYDRDLVNVSNNYIKDCDGRFIKLQTNGLCTVSGNLMKLEKDMVLIKNWKGIDVQCGNSSIINNKIHIGSEWAGTTDWDTGGGVNSTLIQVQRATAANLDYNNEGHITLIKDNVFNLERKIKYAIALEPIAASTQMTLIYRIHNNTIQGGADSDIGGDDSTTVRPDAFIYSAGSDWPKPDVWTGRMVWDIRDNMVDCLEFLEINGGVDTIATSAINTGADTITITGHNYSTSDKVVYHNGGGTSATGLSDPYPYWVIRVDDNTIKLATTAANAAGGTGVNITGTGTNDQYIATDYHGKWFLYIINNTKWPAALDKKVLNTGEIQTSSLCVSGNTNGKDSLRVNYSIDFAELLAGCNFGTAGDMRVRNDPGTYRNCNIRRDRIWVVEDGTEFFTAATVAAGASWTTTT